MPKNLYQVIWSEIHSCLLNAESPERAISNALKRKDLLSENIKIEESPFAQKIDKKFAESGFEKNKLLY